MFVNHVKIFYSQEDIEEYHTTSPEIVRIQFVENGNVTIYYKQLDEQGQEYSKFIPFTSYRNIKYTKEILVPK
ncbi:MAG: hypothetical protein Q7U35_05765 [Methanobacteriaceae archaeon]|nr:hypothetical protein [Methanobacteriaceae archaeon]MDP2835826.1 hypothetical protein [Methanobacteriaceae archaeon]MDP3034629.1 hypothetical protein [Methanobacteriaceae archaeon]MDP3623284.1 hypothetical protein [Methanobacteriaceae archaeon]